MAESKIIELHNKLVNGEITIKEIFDQNKANYEKMKDTNSMITDTFNLIDCEALQSQIKDNKDNILFAIPYTLKDNIVTKGIRTTGGSNFLRNFIPPYDSTVHKTLSSYNAMLLGKANLDEFGFGHSGLTTAYGEVKNVLNRSKITSGSSSGSVNLVAGDVGVFSIGTDTGDSVRKPSSYLGVVGFKPSYGAISRFGVYPYSPSLDHVGIIAKYVTDVAIVSQYLFKFDEKDYTSENHEAKYYENLKPTQNLKIAIFDDIEQFLCKEVLEEYQRVIKLLKDNNIIVEKIKVDWELLKTLYMSYRFVSYSEGLSCYHNMTGITFGSNFDKDIVGYKNMILNNRTEGFGKEIKFRFIYGHLLDKFEDFSKCLKKAQKAGLIYSKFIDNILKDYDAYLVPCTGSTVPSIEDFKKGKNNLNYVDDLYLLGNFAHSPSITLPTGHVDNMPWCINLNCKHGDDQKLLNAALRLEQIFNFYNEDK